MDPAQLIARLRAQGCSWHTIAARLNRDGVPTCSGSGQWWPATCMRAVDRPAWASYMRDYRKGHPGAAH